MSSPNLDNMLAWCKERCENANVGYSQNYRNQQTVGGITYYDCSSFVNYALLACGFETPSYAPSHNAFTTFTMGACLESLGFHKVTDGTLKPGDIGVENSSRMEHTEMVYQVDSSGTKAYWCGAHTDGVPLADQVSITYVWQGSWFENIYRYDFKKKYDFKVTTKKLKSNGAYYEGATLSLHAKSDSTYQQIEKWKSTIEPHVSSFSLYLSDGESRDVYLKEESTGSHLYKLADTVHGSISTSKTSLTLTMTNKINKGVAYISTNKKSRKKKNEIFNVKVRV